MSTRDLATVACLALLAGSLACSEAARLSDTNVLLIIIDTLRADKLGCYGGSRGLSPQIDRLAADGVRFERAYAHAPWTLPAMASLLTSLHPQEHGAGGRLVMQRADLHLALPRDLPAAHDVDPEAGDVDHDEVVLEAVADPAGSLHVHA